MKKIIFVGANPDSVKIPHPGGQITASKNILDMLNKKGINAEIIDTVQSSFPPPPFNQKIYKGLKRIVRVFNLALSKKYSTIFIFAGSGFSFIERILLSLISKALGLKTFLFLRSGHLISLIEKNIAFRQLFKILINRPDYICVQGLNWKIKLKEYGRKNKILIVRNWISDIPEQLSKNNYGKNKIKRFIFVGWLVKEKGLYELIDAVKILLNNGMNFKLDIIGDGTLYKEIKKSIGTYNLENYVSMHGWCDKRKTFEMYSRADVFVLPSYAEGFPNSLLEAMHFGLPCISTDVGGISDSVKTDMNGYLIKPQSATDIAESMSKYINDQSLIEKHSIATKKILHENHNKDTNFNELFSHISP